MIASKDYFDIVVIIPLEEELIQFMHHFPSRADRSTGLIFMHEVDAGAVGIRMLVVQQQGMGKTHAINSTAKVLSDFEVGLMVCLGIAGGLSSDLTLGDVCYSRTITDVLDNSKVVDIEDETSTTELSPTHFTTPVEFVTAMNFIRTQPAVRPLYDSWLEQRKAEALLLAPSEVPMPDGSKALLAEPKTMSGGLVCGAVSKSKVYNSKLRGIDRAFLAIETESGGVFSQALLHDTPAIAIRGISDYADKDKGNLEVTSKGGIRQLAASNAASFLKIQLQNCHFTAALFKRRVGPQSRLPIQQSTITIDPLADAIEQISHEADLALRKLSPEYKLQAKGYRLPIPRMRKISAAREFTEGHKPELLGVRRLITSYDRALINLPRSYPDQSFAWILVDDLVTAEVEGKQVVPIHIDGADIRGRKFSLERLATIDLENLQKDARVQVVFIIDNAPIENKHHFDLLHADLENFPDAKFIFVSKEDSHLVSESEFLKRTNATEFEICSISFMDIAHFIQKNFDMDGSESEVVALRLRDTFERFDLDAHPTYFAGIPKETLSALLQANRRSELIQLAVDGFLTFLVADDKEAVALSRTTRSRFLRRLVIQMNVEKVSFDDVQLIEFTKAFAKEHDFDIDPRKFIHAFEKQGILHFETGTVRISLPFIESYLLASELSLKPNIAEHYFQIDDESFDMVTFDLYAEIGASDSIVQAVTSGLSSSRAIMASHSNEKHILLTDEIMPSSFAKPERVSAIRKQIGKALDAVTNGQSNSDEKQRIIDLSERVADETSRHHKVKNKSTEDDPESHSDDHGLDWSEREQRLINAGRHWSIATILLGAGAEHLDAQTKRKLSSEIVGCASGIIDEWSRLRMEIDFDGLKKHLLSPEVFKNLPGPEKESEKVKFVDGMLDILEYSTLADPLLRVVGFLCEQARHQVLANSIEKAKVDGEIDRLIHATWLADIDTKKGKPHLKNAMSSLPRAAFLRSTLASHYLSRVYWNHWKKDDRLSLLDAALEIVSPLNLDIKGPELKRLIGREEKIKAKSILPKVKDIDS